MTQDYIPILLIFALGLILALALVIMSSILGTKKPSQVKLMPYECGVDPVGSARDRYSVKFYLVGMIFLLFDIEAVFLIPWAVVFNSMSKWLIYGEMMVFMVVLLVGYAYVWRKGLFEWNR